MNPESQHDTIRRPVLEYLATVDEATGGEIVDEIDRCYLAARMDLPRAEDLFDAINSLVFRRRIRRTEDEQHEGYAYELIECSSRSDHVQTVIFSVD